MPSFVVGYAHKKGGMRGRFAEDPAIRDLDLI